MSDLELVENAARAAAEKVKHRMPDGAALLLAFADALARIIEIKGKRD